VKDIKWDPTGGKVTDLDFAIISSDDQSCLIDFAEEAVLTGSSCMEISFDKDGFVKIKRVDMG